MGLLVVALCELSFIQKLIFEIANTVVSGTIEFVTNLSREKGGKISGKSFFFLLFGQEKIYFQ